MTERWYEKAIIYCLDVETFQDSTATVSVISTGLPAGWTTWPGSALTAYG